MDTRTWISVLVLLVLSVEAIVSTRLQRNRATQAQAQGDVPDFILIDTSSTPRAWELEPLSPGATRREDRRQRRLTGRLRKRLLRHRPEYTGGSDDGKEAAAEPNDLMKHQPRTATLRDNCCENGGMCIMGSFCMCPVGFTGRFCEEGARPCGSLEHGKAGYLACSLCVCDDAWLACAPYHRHNCDEDVHTLAEILLNPTDHRVSTPSPTNPAVDPDLSESLTESLKESLTESALEYVMEPGKESRVRVSPVQSSAARRLATNNGIWASIVLIGYFVALDHILLEWKLDRY